MHYTRLVGGGLGEGAFGVSAGWNGLNRNGGVCWRLFLDLVCY
jgi:hypothetical protein